VLVVSPNNPTGNYIDADDLERLARICRTRALALISDEVFSEYDLEEPLSHGSGDQGRALDRPSLAERDDVLGFTLGGLSKSIGLPQAKLGWIVVSGPPADVRAAVSRLELACDTYLSVSTPVQLAARDLLRRGAVIRDQIHARVRNHYTQCSALVAQRPACRVLHAEGGWNAVIQVPTLMSEEELALALLRDAHVLIHPGYFFDFASESFLVVSLLAPTDTFVAGLTRVLERFDTDGLDA
jgi:alanine-synthesizing transaminase